MTTLPPSRIQTLLLQSGTITAMVLGGFVLSRVVIGLGWNLTVTPDVFVPPNGIKTGLAVVAAILLTLLALRKGGTKTALLRYVLNRFGSMAITLIIISLLIFVIIKLPPGDFLTNQIAELRAQGEGAAVAKAEFLIKQYGLDKSVLEQYLAWVGLWPGPNGLAGLLQGEWGWSFEYDKPCRDVIGDALFLTLLLNLAVVVFVHVVSIPIAIYSATRQYSFGDYVATFVGYIGLATPSFLLALILLFYMNRWFGVSIGGLYDGQFAGQPWSWAKVQSFLSHAIAPIIVIGLGGTAAMIRRMRANLLDELGKPYYVTAKAKGLPPGKALLKYPFRMSLNPFMADIGNLLPGLVSGSVLVSLVLSLPTVGPILLTALKSQDQFLAGFILMFVALLTVVGMLISDLMLAWLDPRIRVGGRAR